MVSSERRLVHIVDDLSVLEGATELTMVSVLDGFLDAGNAAGLAADHLLSVHDGPVVATFDVDVLHDYRARRPAVSFVEDHYERFEAPRLVVRLLRADDGSPYLLLRGPEPDVRWEAFARAVREVVHRLGVATVVSLGAVPMAVPHTRPLAITQHANRAELVTEKSPWEGELRVPSSASALVELRLGEWGHDAMGFVAHVPHYLSQVDYPAAAAVLLERLERAGRVLVDLSDLREFAQLRHAEISGQLGDSQELAQLVSGLEQQYDAFMAAAADGNNLLAKDQPLPSGEELGRQFEQFLAGLDDPETP